MQTEEKRLWDKREYFKELIVTIRINKKVVENNLTRQEVSRDLMICMFSIHGISGGKEDTASDPGQDVYLRSCHFLLFFRLLWVVFSSILCWGIRSAPWEYAFCGVSTAPSSVPTTPTGQTFKADFEMLKRPVSPVLCLRRESGTNSSYMETSCEFVLCCQHMFSPHKCPQILLTQGMWAALTFPFQTHVEQTVASPRLKPGLSSHKCTQQTMCLTLASP